MAEPVSAQLQERPATKGWRGWFQRTRPPSAAPRSRWRRDDLTVAALGLTLGLICALFPWYIFLNPDKFGPPVIAFDGGKGASGIPRQGGGGQGRLGSGLVLGMPEDTFDPMSLDLFATGSTPDPHGPEAAPAEAEQPFPVEPVAFRLVYAANGRAMMEDDTGVFVVAPGDRLPDNSRVARIEERSGRWVVVTSTERVLEAE